MTPSKTPNSFQAKPRQTRQCLDGLAAVCDVARGVILSADGVFEPAELEKLESALTEISKPTLEDKVLQETLAACQHANWRLCGARGAAARLGLKRTTVFYKMKRPRHRARIGPQRGLIPVWLQIVHLLVADLLWIWLIFASADPLPERASLAEARLQEIETIPVSFSLDYLSSFIRINRLRDPDVWQRHEQVSDLCSPSFRHPFRTEFARFRNTQPPPPSIVS